MIKPIIRWLKRLPPWSIALLGHASDHRDEEPDKTRRMVLVGSVALIGSSLLLPDLIPRAEAHDRRRRRRRRRRRPRYYNRRHRRLYYRRRRRRRRHLYYDYGYGYNDYGYGYNDYGYGR